MMSFSFATGEIELAVFLIIVARQHRDTDNFEPKVQEVAKKLGVINEPGKAPHCPSMSFRAAMSSVSKGNEPVDVDLADEFMTALRLADAMDHDQNIDCDKLEAVVSAPISWPTSEKFLKDA